MTDPDSAREHREIQPRPERELAAYGEGGASWLATRGQRRYAPAQPPHPGWANYSAQRHLRAMALDAARGRLWLASWGGVLCWEIEQGLCTRYSSEHGLAGNATRAIAVDESGVTWAISEGGALAWIEPDSSVGWRLHDLHGWSAQALASQPGGGIVVTLRDARGRGALGQIKAHGSPLLRRLEGQLACLDVAALLFDQAGGLWLGNDWGLFRDRGGAEADCFDLSLDKQGRRGVRVRVQALAPASAAGQLWAGTSWGLYLVDATTGSWQPAIAGLSESIRALASDPSGQLWVAGDLSQGRVVGQQWLPLEQPPPGPVEALLLAPPRQPPASIDGIERPPRIFAAGAQGLYSLASERNARAFEPAPEDAISNAVRALYVANERIWTGGTRGLASFDGRAWQSLRRDHDDELDNPGEWDVQGFAPGQSQGRLLVAAGRAGLRRLQGTLDLPGSALEGHIVALAAGEDGSLWAAAPDTLYWRPSGGQWREIPLRGCAIRCLCPQAGAAPAIWIGTSRGLVGYRPELDQLEPGPPALEQLSIGALAVDPQSGQLWAGTSRGLFGEPGWQCHHAQPLSVAALAFGPEGSLWAGTSHGLERWDPAQRQQPAAGEQQLAPAERLSAASSGLAADMVMALAVRTLPAGGYELWAGTPHGLSRLSVEL